MEAFGAPAASTCPCAWIAPKWSICACWGCGRGATGGRELEQEVGIIGTGPGIETQMVPPLYSRHIY